MSDKYEVKCVFPSKEVAQDFVSWMCNSGEQLMWDAPNLDRQISYDYEEGSFVIGDKFDEEY